ncbi:uncharacterized protein LOC101958830 [Ictidomys tridecemlineatus]
MCKGLAALPHSCLERAKEIKIKLGTLLQKPDSAVDLIIPYNEKVQKPAKPQKPSRDEALQWRDSLDKLLQNDRKCSGPGLHQGTPGPLPTLATLSPANGLTGEAGMGCGCAVARRARRVEGGDRPGMQGCTVQAVCPLPAAPEAEEVAGPTCCLLCVLQRPSLAVLPSWP